MSRNIKLLLFVVLFANFQIFKFSNCLAQVPQKFNYQGIARDAKGNPMAKQALALKLSVLPTSDAISPEYEEIQHVLTNEFGLYTLQIGNGASTSLSTFKDIKWETGNKYIKVMIDPKGGNDFVDAGTNQLLSVPYAIYADKAGMAKNAGGDRTGTVSSNATHIIGDTNFLTKFTGLNIIGKSQLFDNGTNLGIGTTSPIARLHMTSNVATPQEHIRMENLNPAGAGRFTMYNDVTNAFATFTKYGTTAVGGSPGISALYPFANLLAFGNNETGTAGNGRFLISTEGNTGISLLKSGTAKLKLHIDYATERVGIGGNSVPAAQVHFNNTASTNDTTKFTNNTTGHTTTDGFEIRTNGNNARLINRENAFLLLGTRDSDRVAITGAGNVGIGTIAPATRLDVNGQVRVQGGTPGVGKVLTSDATGLATWQNPLTNVAASNGLSKTNDTLLIGGRLTQATTLSQDGRSFILADTTGTASAFVTQLAQTGSSALSATARTQTFTASSSRLLHSIDLRLTGIASTSVTAELRNAQGTVLGSQTITFGSLYDSLVNFSFPAKPLMQAGLVYTIHVTGSTGSNWFLSSGNPFAGGIASTNASEDFTFQVNSMDEGLGFVAVANRVGIGTAVPSAKLDVNGDIRIQGGNPGLGKVLTSDANGLASWQMPGIDSQWAKNGNHIFNNNSGNVGIGTSTPTSVLHVASPFSEIRLQNTAINTSLYITAPFNGGTGGIGTDGNHELPFFTNNIERMVIKNDGRMGIGTNVPKARLHVADSAVVFSAIGDTAIATFNNKPPIEGVGRRMMWYPERGAFRAGGLASSSSVSQNWNRDSIGAYSIAMGWNTKATGRSAVAMGDKTTASGENSTAMGRGTIARGENSTAMGEFTIASGSSSTAMGSNTIASGDNSTAMGFLTTASGGISTAMGFFTTASGDHSTAMGSKTTANGFVSLVIGQFNDTLVAPQTAMSSTTPLFIIGNGTASNARSNVMVARNDGRVGIGSSAPASTLETGASFGAAITTTSTNLTLTEAHHTVIVTGGTPSLTLPSPTAVNRRIYILVNHTATNRTVSSYFNLSGAVTSTIPPTSSITIQSNGSNWYQIR